MVEHGQYIYADRIYEKSQVGDSDLDGQADSGIDFIVGKKYR